MDERWLHSEVWDFIIQWVASPKPILYAGLFESKTVEFAHMAAGIIRQSILHCQAIAVT